jgi:hypothetical protein
MDFAHQFPIAPLSIPSIVGHHVVRENEFVREKHVIIKDRCRYCKGAFNDEIGCCPHCGGTR